MGASADGREIVAEAFRLAMIELADSSDPDRILNPSLQRCLMAGIVRSQRPVNPIPLGWRDMP